VTHGDSSQNRVVVGLLALQETRENSATHWEIAQRSETSNSLRVNFSDKSELDFVRLRRTVGVDRPVRVVDSNIELQKGKPTMNP
jgi:hypothetical protein